MQTLDKCAFTYAEWSEMYRSMMASVSIGERMSGEREEKYEPFMLLFQADDTGYPQLATITRSCKPWGEVLMLPVVDESEVKPTKESFYWQYSGEPTTGDKRLTPEEEQVVLESLSEQLGYRLRVEPREVNLLSMEPEDEAKD